MKIAFLLIVLFLSTQILGQSPTDISYTDDSEYKSAVSWSISTDSKGLIWSGPIGEGACAFNGNKFYHWTEKDGLAGNIVIAYAEDSHGNMWFSSQSNGLSIFDGRKFHTISTSDSVGLNSDNVMSIFHHSEGYTLLGTFQNKIQLFKNGIFSDVGDSILTVYDMAEDVDGNVWMATRGSNLAKWDGKELTFIDLNESKKPRMCLDVELDDQGRVYIASINDIYRYDPSTKEMYEFSEHYNLKDYTNFSGIILQKDGGIYCSAGDNHFLIKDGKVIPQNGHNAISSTTRMVSDKIGNVWSATNGSGLKNFQFNGVRKYSVIETYYIKAAAESPSGQIYLASGSGLWRADTAKSERLATWDNDQIDQLASLIAVDDENFYLASSHVGLFHFNLNTGKRELVYDKLIYNADRESDTTIIFAKQSGWARYNIKTKKTESFAPIPDYAFVSIACNDQGHIYMGGYTDGKIIRIENSDTIVYGEQEGLTKDSKTDLRFGPDGRLWYLSINGGFGFLEGNEFINFEPILSGETNSFEIDANGDLWISAGYGILHVHLENNKIIETSLFGPAQGVNTGVSKMGANLKTSDGRILIPKAANSVFVINPKKIKRYKEVPVVYIEKVMGKDYTDLNPDWYSSYAPLWGTPKNPHLPYEFNNLSVNLGTIYYSQPDSIKYQYRLIGFEDEWSVPQVSNLISFTNLPSGEFSLEVKSISPSAESEVITYNFSVETPWHQTIWFYILLILGSGLALYVIIKFRIRKLQNDKERLELEVAERTSEVVNEKEKVTKAYLHLEEKNQEILDSITYAKRIQQAILPPDKLVYEHLQNSFIIYIPKDIVAGDFYWMEPNEKGILFAAADCTGHGVPGAMVSVICNNGLNRSVREYGLSDPGQILDSTRDIVIAEFEKSEEEVKDGMDIALCRLEGKHLQYAGANNPLWLIRKGSEEIEEYKANKQPIGKFDKPQTFKTHLIELSEGDTFYIFSDGYPDQFGGNKGKKFKTTNLKKLLLSIQNLEMSQQKEEIENTFQTWKGDLEQLDDVCVIGVRI